MLIPIYNITHEVIMMKWPVFIINIVRFMKCS